MLAITIYLQLGVGVGEDLGSHRDGAVDFIFTIIDRSHRPTIQAVIGTARVQPRHALGKAHPSPYQPSFPCHVGLLLQL